MKNIIAKIAIAILVLLIFERTHLSAQTIQEVTQPLSKKALKGYVHHIESEKDGSLHITYKIKGGKKTNEVFYERYSFGPDLKFISANDVKEEREQNPPKETQGFYAHIGGNTSFDVLSQKLKIVKTKNLYEWSKDRQRYEYKKTLSRETIKPRNDDGKVYLGCAEYSSYDYTKSDLLILAKSESKQKGNDSYMLLLFDETLNLREKPLDLKGEHTLVYCEQVNSDEVVAVFAPNKGNGTATSYVYFKMDILGNIKSRIEFTSPTSALLLTAAYEENGNVYFFGTSGKSSDTFEKEYNEYSPIYNPGYTGLGRNSVDFKWQKSANSDMVNFHLLKFDDSKLAFASTTPVKEFKSKFRTAPGDKGAKPYKGKRFSVFNFQVLANGDYLISGQVTDRIMLEKNLVESYEDIICFQFDKAGVLKAQYGVGKVNEEKKSAIFSNTQRFIPSADGKSIYWIVNEVIGTRGFESFMDAYNNTPTFYANYYPRITKIDLESSTLSPFKTPGEGKYYLRKNLNSIIDSKTNTITYIGHDKKYTKLWLSRVTLD